MIEYWESWEQVRRFDGNRVYTAYKCPQCQGSGNSPYHDTDRNIIPCECCYGKGFYR